VRPRAKVTTDSLYYYYEARTQSTQTDRKTDKRTERQRMNTN